MFSRKVFDNLYDSDQLFGGADVEGEGGEPAVEPDMGGEPGDAGADAGMEGPGEPGDAGMGEGEPGSNADSGSGLPFAVPGFLKNQYIVLFLLLICVLYSSYFVPKLPDSVIMFFDSLIGRFIFIALIAFVSTRNLMISLVIALIFIIILQVSESRKKSANVTMEGFNTNMGDDDIDCSDADDCKNKIDILTRKHKKFTNSNSSSSNKSTENDENDDDDDDKKMDDGSGTGSRRSGSRSGSAGTGSGDADGTDGDDGDDAVADGDDAVADGDDADADADDTDSGDSDGDGGNEDVTDDDEDEQAGTGLTNGKPEQFTQRRRRKKKSSTEAVNKNIDKLKGMGSTLGSLGNILGGNGNEGFNLSDGLSNIMKTFSSGGKMDFGKLEEMAGSVAAKANSKEQLKKVASMAKKIKKKKERFSENFAGQREHFVNNSGYKPCASNDISTFAKF